MENIENMQNGDFGRGGRWRKPGRGEFGPDRRHHRRGGRHGFGPEFGPGFDPGYGPHFGRGRGRGGRGRRGDVRAAVLLLLTERPMHGYELIQQIRERSDDIWRPSPGSIYPALAQLEDEGLVLIEKVAGRKTAKLTEAGTEYVAAHREELGDPWAEVKADVGTQAIDLRGLVGQVMGAVGQVAAVGTPEQAAKAAEILNDTRRSLYRILAEDDAEQ
ncbi:PadR family transcriptional regulator [Nocardia sp. NPDC050793]|uniref:PadR family transcriptional regulator n=1 Tax=Nocardia sp. NPDC050793 TaxID=3155159 RepID=UPI0033F16E81